MSVITPTIPEQPEAAIASYAYTDIVDRTGIVLFYGYVAEDSSGKSYKLSQKDVFSAEIEVSGDSPISSDSWIKKSDRDYDLSSFNLPRIIKGNATIILSYGLTLEDTETYILVKLRKYDGSSETEIGSAQSKTVNSDDSPATAVLEITCPQTHFKAGDILRLTIEQWGRRTAGEGASSVVYHGSDPKNRDGSNIVPSTNENVLTQILAYIPFKIDL